MSKSDSRTVGAMREIRDAALAAGWTVEHSGGNHLRWTPPAGQGGPVFTSATPSDRRAVANMRRDFRKHGLIV